VKSVFYLIHERYPYLSPPDSYHLVHTVSTRTIYLIHSQSHHKLKHICTIPILPTYRSISCTSKTGKMCWLKLVELWLLTGRTSDCTARRWSCCRWPKPASERERESEQERARSIDGVDNPHRRSVHVDDGLTTACGSAWMIVVLLRRETRRDGCNDHSQSLLWCYAEARYFAVERCLSDRHFVCLSITTKHASNRLVEFLLLPAWYSQISIVFATNRRY